jgi:hypothetical protein
MLHYTDSYVAQESLLFILDDKGLTGEFDQKVLRLKAIKMEIQKILEVWNTFRDEK